MHVNSHKRNLVNNSRYFLKRKEISLVIIRHFVHVGLALVKVYYYIYISNTNLIKRTKPNHNSFYVLVLTDP